MTDKIEIFERHKGELSDKVFTLMQDVRPDAEQYLLDNNIKLSVETIDDDNDLLIFFGEADNAEITVSAVGTPCADAMDKGVELLKEQKTGT